MRTTDTDIMPGVTLGMSLDVHGLGQVVLEEQLVEQGGYGVMFRGVRQRTGTEVAVKFMREVESDSAEERQRDFDRFRREAKTLQRFCKGWESGEYGCEELMPPFPAFCRSGKLWGTPFYVMEWLRPVNLLSIDTNDKRYKYVWDVCYAVSTLHNAGYVHYDIKPSNIMMRQRENGDIDYVIVDFGSVHRIESSCRPCPARSVSLLSDGRRVFPHTPGYADPQETLHTINADIYAIGQVIRDTFAESVSPEWAAIIDRCTSRNRAYRYPNVASIVNDLERLKVARYELTSSEDLCVWCVQKAVSEEKAVEMSWLDLRGRLAFQSQLLNDDEYPTSPGWLSPVSELLIDFGRLDCRNIYIKEPIHMTPFGLLVIRGNGKISIELDGDGQTDCDSAYEDAAQWDEPIYPFVILLDGATLSNRTQLDNEEAQLMYMVGRYCLLHFPLRSVSTAAEDSRYILTGRAGYSFVRNGSQVGERGLYGILSEGCHNLFSQQKWDEFDIRGIIRVLRRIRPWQRQGEVHDWLERNVESILMRNLGRYEIGS